ncbi:MAG: ROK family protein [Phycisphaeraceae bacterium]|nr:ROK family protein [Phycisphaeraceae bacterium]
MRSSRARSRHVERPQASESIIRTRAPAGECPSFSKLSERVIFEFLVSRMRATLSQMADHLDIPTSTLSRVLSELEDRHMVARRTERSGRRGRPEVTFQVRIPSRKVVCQFDGSQVTAAIFDPELRCVGQQGEGLIRIDSPDAAARQVGKLLRILTEKTGVNRLEMSGLALSLNAVWTGQNTFSSSVLPWADQTVTPIFEKELGLPVQLVVPFAPRAMAEYQALSVPFPDSMAHFLVDDGVSAHCIVHGRPLRGSTCLAGELGHVTVTPDGPTCGCGRTGCLEAWCSGPALSRQLIEELRRQPNRSCLELEQLEESSPRRVIQRVWEAWQQGDEVVRNLMEPTFNRLAWALGAVVNFMDPQQVTVGGYVLFNKPAWLEQIRERSTQYILRGDKRTVLVEPGRATREDELRVIAAWSAYPKMLETYSVNEPAADAG